MNIKVIYQRLFFYLVKIATIYWNDGRCSGECDQHFFIKLLKVSEHPSGINSIKGLCFSTTTCFTIAIGVFRL